MTALHHISVMSQEVLKYLNPTPGKAYVDGTLGATGHFQQILTALQSYPRDTPLSAPLIGIDRDPQAIAHAEKQFHAFSEEGTIPKNAPSILFLHGNYSQLETLLSREKLLPITGGVLFDLGVGSFHFDEGDRGFSFSKKAPLDMRLDPHHQELTAAQIINEWEESALVDLFSRYGEARFSKTIARRIIQQRQKQPLTSTTDLANLIETVYQQKQPRKETVLPKHHPATQVFQALRITVNDEMSHLQSLLEQLPRVLAPRARIVFISFHSLEDRLVKRFFSQESRGCICPPDFPVCQCHHAPRLRPLTKKPVTASQEEKQENPRSRSAKLRAAEWL